MNNRDEMDIYNEIVHGNLDELMRNGILKIIHNDSNPDKKIYRLTQKGTEYVMKRVDEKEDE